MYAVVRKMSTCLLTALLSEAEQTDWHFFFSAKADVYFCLFCFFFETNTLSSFTWHGSVAQIQIGPVLQAREAILRKTKAAIILLSSRCG